MSTCTCGRPVKHTGTCARRCEIPGCGRKHYAGGMCGSHYMRKRRHGDPLAGPAPRRELHIEDVEWLAETGEVWENAWRRLSYPSAAALQRALERLGRYDLVSRLKARESVA